MECAEVAVAHGRQNGDGAAALLRTGLTHLQRGEYEAAIAIHSAADFNLYVPANAGVFAWILGISADV